MSQVKDDAFRCSFCRKSQSEVKKLIAGPGVYICNECIDICNEIIEDDMAALGDVAAGERKHKRSAATQEPLPPADARMVKLFIRQIEEFLDENARHSLIRQLIDRTGFNQ